MNISNSKLIHNYEKNYSDDLVKNADIIWIQSNAIKHSFYSKVVNTARKWDIPCRYFQYAGVQKCVQQIMELRLRE